MGVIIIIISTLLKNSDTCGGGRLDSVFHGGSDGAPEKSPDHILDTDILDTKNIFLDMTLPKTGPCSFESPCFKTARSGFVIENGHKLRKKDQFEAQQSCECARTHVKMRVRGFVWSLSD